MASQNLEAKTSVVQEKQEENAIVNLPCGQTNVRSICGKPCRVKGCQSTCVLYQDHQGLDRCENWHWFD